MTIPTNIGRSTAPAARITFIGHATTRLEFGTTVLLTDPVLRGRVAVLRSSAPTPDDAAVGSLAAVLISHLHRDHCDLPSLRALGHDRTLVVPATTERFFRRAGFRRLIPLAEGSSCVVDGVTITAVHAEHDGRRWPLGAPRPATGFLVEAAGTRVYFAGDTDLFDGMSELAQPDVALIPVWGWGPSVGAGHLDPVRAADAVDLIEPAVAVPIHWGTLGLPWQWQRSLDRGRRAAALFGAEVAHRGSGTRVVTLSPGQSMTQSVSAGQVVGPSAS